MTSSCAKRCAATLGSTTNTACIPPYTTFLRSPLRSGGPCNYVSTKPVQDPAPVHALICAPSARQRSSTVPPTPTKTTASTIRSTASSRSACWRAWWFQLSTPKRRARFVLSLSVRRPDMSRQSSSRTSKTDWARVRAMSNRDIAVSPEHPEASMQHIVRGIARRGLQPVPPKASISLRLDADVLEWLKAQGPGYQTRINAILRAFKDASA